MKSGSRTAGLRGIAPALIDTPVETRSDASREAEAMTGCQQQTKCLDQREAESRDSRTRPALVTGLSAVGRKRSLHRHLCHVRFAPQSGHTRALLEMSARCANHILTRHSKSSAVRSSRRRAYHALAGVAPRSGCPLEPGTVDRRSMRELPGNAIRVKQFTLATGMVVAVCLESIYANAAHGSGPQ